jgi:hypothetical protein
MSVPRRTTPSAAATSKEFRQNCVMVCVILPRVAAWSDFCHSAKGCKLGRTLQSLIQCHCLCSSPLPNTPTVSMAR